MEEKQTNYILLFSIILTIIVILIPLYSIRNEEKKIISNNATCSEVVVNGEVYQSKSCNLKSNTLELDKEQSNNQTKELSENNIEKYNGYIKKAIYFLIWLNLSIFIIGYTIKLMMYPR